LEPIEGYEEAANRIKEKTHPLFTPSGKYELAVFLLFFDMIGGWIFAGIITYITAFPLTQVLILWFISLIAIFLVYFILHGREKRKRSEGILLALREFHTIGKKTVTSKELASILPIGVNEAESLLNYLKNRGAVRSPHEGCWELATQQEDTLAKTQNTP